MELNFKVSRISLSVKPTHNLKFNLYYLLIILYMLAGKKTAKSSAVSSVAFMNSLAALTKTKKRRSPKKTMTGDTENSFKLQK